MMIEHGAEVELPQLGEHLQASCPKSLVVAQDWQDLGEVAANVNVAGDLFLFEIKSGMYKFSQKCTKRPKSVQNLDVRLLCFLRQKCAYFAIFGTQLRVYCDFLLKSERITGSMMENLITK